MFFILVAPFVMPWRGRTLLLLRCTIAQQSVCGEIFFEKISAVFPAGQKGGRDEPCHPARTSEGLLLVAAIEDITACGDDGNASDGECGHHAAIKTIASGGQVALGVRLVGGYRGRGIRLTRLLGLGGGLLGLSGLLRLAGLIRGTGLFGLTGLLGSAGLIRGDRVGGKGVLGVGDGLLEALGLGVQVP